MTLYLKYRPQTLDELDAEEVRKVLTKSLQSEKYPHAWLFSGPRGTGKTSSARILAKYINCTAEKGQKPCNKCEMCKAITTGNAVDIVEIDAASNRGIDEIRELKEKLKLAPMKAKYKVFIVDEVHMLTTEAANALLKSLEEPPENTIFILCTTDPGKLPETVISRCSRVVFGKPKMEEIVGKLERVAKGEGRDFSEEDIKTMAKASRGSFRDAIKLMEQVIISGAEVNEVVGLSSGTDSRELLDLVEKGKSKEALELIAKMDAKGENFRRFVESMVEELREKLLAKAGKGDVADEIRWIGGLGRVYEQMKTAAVVQLPLEIWVIQNCGPDTGKDEPVKPAVSRKRIEEPLQTEASAADNESYISIQASGKGKYSLEDLNGKWSEVMKAVRPKNHSVEALLRSTKPMEFDGEKLQLEVFYKFHKDKLETEKCRRIVEEAVEQVIGEKGVKLYLKLGQKIKKVEEEVTAEGVDEEVISAAEEIFGAQAI